MDTGSFGDLYTWILDEEVYGKVFRVWRDVGNGFEKYFQTAYFVQFIELPNKDFMVGLKLYYADANECDDSIQYYRLSKLRFEYHPCDQPKWEEDCLKEE